VAVRGWALCICLSVACRRQEAADPAETNAAVGRLTQSLDDERADRVRCDNLLDNLSRNLDSTRDELLAVRRQRDEIAQRRTVFDELKIALAPLLTAGTAVAVSNGNLMSFNLSATVLFASGEAKLSSAGQEALAPVAQVLASFPSVRFMIAGHTDSAPMIKGPLLDNWELSVARALEVMRVLVAHGASPKNLAIAGYADTMPAAPNDTSEGRQANRRIELVLVPGATTVEPTETSGTPTVDAAAPEPRFDAASVVIDGSP